jgi:hypothetical protein
MTNQATGVILSIGETQTVGANFTKRPFVLMTDETTQYPQYVEFELQGDRCDMIDAYQVNQKVVIDYNLKGRQWTNPQGQLKTFNTLVCWKIQPKT